MAKYIYIYICGFIVFRGFVLYIYMNIFLYQ